MIVINKCDMILIINIDINWNINYIAMDKCGTWAAYESKPVIDLDDTMWSNGGGEYVDIRDHKNVPHPVWKKSMMKIQESDLTVIPNLEKL